MDALEEWGETDNRVVMNWFGEGVVALRTAGIQFGAFVVALAFEYRP